MLNFISNLLSGLTAAVADWQQRQQAYAELFSLDDRSLADIGISRSEIPYVLSQVAAARNPRSMPAPANGNLQRAA
jgi:uncharacterized protein YjiS (DUF1127 family)